MKTQNNDSVKDENATCDNAVLGDVFLLNSGFVKANGKFGEYFKHQKHELFRCWFFEGKLQIGKKDIEKDCTFWFAEIENEFDFNILFKIVCKESINNLEEYTNKILQVASEKAKVKYSHTETSGGGYGMIPHHSSIYVVDKDSILKSNS